MKNLILITCAFLFIAFSFSSCQKEDIVELTNATTEVSTEDTANKKYINLTQAGPEVKFGNYNPTANYDCCQATRYKVNDATYNYYVVNQDNYFKVIYDEGTSNEVVHITQSKFLYKYWSSNGYHTIIIRISDQYGNTSGPDSNQRTDYHYKTPSCTPC